MKHILTAGTDAASVLLFDPESLPGEVDGCEHPGDLFPELEKQGRLCWVSTDGDGSYLLHVYVDEAPPESLAGVLREPQWFEAFSVASGKLYFTGAEYGFHRDDSMLRKHPQMGSFYELAPGSYAMEVYRAEFPDNAMTERFRERASSIEVFLHGLFPSLVALSILIAFATAISAAIFPWRWWLARPVPIAVTTILINVGVYYLPSFRKSQAIWQEVQREFPSLVAVMRRNR